MRIQKDNICVVSKDSLDSSFKSGSIVDAMYCALNSNEFHLAYQSQVNARGKITGVEALARWQHPRHGNVPPTKFIPAAEQSGLILPFGQWVLKTVCLQLAEWATTMHFSDLTISFNVSPLEFTQPNFSETVLSTIRETGAIATNLKMEITESYALNSYEDAAQKLLELKHHGITCSLDDYGTGHSSLTRLKLLPLDQLKIDKSFVSDMLTSNFAAIIVRSTIEMARQLGLAIIAEGVETIEQHELLLSMGCTDFQGYLYSRALPIRDFEQHFLERRILAIAPDADKGLRNNFCKIDSNISSYG